MTRFSIGEARKLVSRVQLAADVSGQQGDVEGLDQLHQCAQLDQTHHTNAARLRRLCCLF